MLNTSLRMRGCFVLCSPLTLQNDLVTLLPEVDADLFAAAAANHIFRFADPVPLPAGAAAAPVRMTTYRVRAVQPTTVRLLTRGASQRCCAFAAARSSTAAAAR